MRYRVLLALFALLLLYKPDCASAFAAIALNHNHGITVLSQRVGTFEYQTGDKWYDHSTAFYFDGFNITVPVPFYVAFGALIIFAVILHSWICQLLNPKQ
jgi:hypothetical protein